MKNFRPKTWSLRDRLLATIAFFDVFDVPVKVDDIRKLIIGDNDFDDNDFNRLVKENLNFVVLEDGYLYLAGRKNMIKKAAAAYSISQNLIKKAQKKSSIFNFIPFIRSVSICNFLPFGIAEKNSDIDLFVVVDAKKIFTARLFLTMFSHFARIRRHGDKTKGRFCLSFYADSGFLDMNELLISPYDVYFAYWMIGLLPIYGSREFITNILEENKLWLRSYFSNIDSRYFKVNTHLKKKKLINVFFEKLLSGNFGNWVESRLADYFIARHKKRVNTLPDNASVEVSHKRLKFHNHDKRRFFAEEFEKRLKRLGLFK